MKKLLIALVCIAIVCITAFAMNNNNAETKIESYGSSTIISKSLSERDTTAEALRSTLANSFSSEVGDYLKSHYPSYVSAVVVILEGNSDGIELSYKACIEPCDTLDAHFYFDHRGLMLSSPSSKDWLEGSAKIQVGKRILDVIPRFDEKLGKTNVLIDYDTKVIDGVTHTICEGFLCSKMKRS